MLDSKLNKTKVGIEYYFCPGRTKGMFGWGFEVPEQVTKLWLCVIKKKPPYGPQWQKDILLEGNASAQAGRYETVLHIWGTKSICL